MSLWDDFEYTGAVADYLAYAAMKGMEHADSEGRRPDAADVRGTGQVH